MSCPARLKLAFLVLVLALVTMMIVITEGGLIIPWWWKLGLWKGGWIRKRYWALKLLKWGR